jgi:hypothetical protein
VQRFRLSPLYGRKETDGEWCDPRQIALEEFKHLAATHQPRPLPTEVLVELERILAAAELEAEKI